MADIKKFLDQGGVSTLWSRVAAEVAKVDAKAAANAGEIATLKGKVAALEAGTYDDKEVRELIGANADAIAANKTAHEANAAAIAILNGDAETNGSVAHTANVAAAAEVAKIVAGADADFDTLKEIADWIINDTTGAAEMANNIAALQAQMAGVDETVVKTIAAALEAALKVEGADKYALASELITLADRVKALEDTDFATYTEVENVVDGKIAALNLANTYDAKGAAATAETNAKAYADGLAKNYDASGAAAQALVDAKAYVDGIAANHETKGAAAQALIDAKAYTDAEMAKVQALTEAEIDAAIAAATGTN